MSTTITLNPYVFRDLLVGTLLTGDQTGTTPSIYGICLEWDTVSLFAASTDRYRLSRGVTPATVTGPEGKILMARADMQQLVKLIPTKGDMKHATITIVVASDKVTFTYRDLPAEWAMAYRPEPHQFPDWARLIPEKDVPTETLNFNPAYLADINKMPHDKRVHVKWRLHGENKPASIWWESNSVAWVMLLMPVRTKI